MDRGRGLGRSARHVSDVGAGAYGFDPAGNLTVKDGRYQVFDDAHELCATDTAALATCTTASSTKTTYGYDTRGNRTTITPPDGTQPTTYGYDGENRLTTVTQPGAAGNTGDYTPVAPAVVADTVDGTGGGG
jgi:YD repeat-containing protein